MRKLIFAFAMLIVSSAISGFAATGNWEDVKIEGGSVYSLAHSIHSSQVLLAGGYNSVWRSSDSALSWHIAASNISPRALAFAPSLPGRAYLFSHRYGKVYKSDDEGASWIEAGSLPANFRTDTKDGFGAMVADKANAQVVYLAGYFNSINGPIENSVYKTSDGGLIWERVLLLENLSDNGKNEFATSMVSPSSGVIVVSTIRDDDDDQSEWESGNIFLSDDGGQTWNVKSADGPFFTMMANPQDSNVIYAAAKGGEIYESLDGGQNWTQKNSVTDNLADTIITTLCISTDSGNSVLIAMANDGVRQSQDGGDNWGATFSFDSGIASASNGFCLYSSSDNAVYFADRNGAGIYKNSGPVYSSFDYANNGFYSADIEHVVSDELNANIRYAMSSSDIYVSTDSGISWVFLTPNSAKRAGGIGEALIAYNDAVYFAGGNVLYKGSKVGEIAYTWESYIVPEMSAINALAFNKDKTFFYVAGEANNILESGLSKSNGLNFMSLAFTPYADLNGFFVNRVCASTSTDNLLYISYYGDESDKDNLNASLFKYDGISWEDISPAIDPLGYSAGVGGSFKSLAADKDDSSVLYAANEWYVFKSTNSGSDWQILYSSEQGEIAKMASVKEIGKPAILLLGLDSKILSSLDKGVYWAEAGSGFYALKTLASDFFYAASRQGVYKTDIIAKELSTVSANILVSSFSSSGSAATVNIPASAFGGGVSVMVLPYTQTLPSNLNVSPSALAIDIRTNISTQPANAVSLKFKYSAADIAGLAESKLKIARFDPPSTYIILDSEINTSLKEITANTNHFSIFALVAYSAPAAVSAPEIRAYPMPFNPNKHSGGLKIDNLAPLSSVEIYNLSGQLAVKIYADSSGLAVWNGKNESSKEVASGIYVAVVKNSLNATKRLKIALRK